MNLKIKIVDNALQKFPDLRVLTTVNTLFLEDAGERG
jgi:hypothetical protein